MGWQSLEDRANSSFPSFFFSFFHNNSRFHCPPLSKRCRKQSRLYNAPTTHAPSVVSFHSSSHNCQSTSETYQCPERIALSQDRFFTSNESPQSHQLRFSSVPPISAWLVFLWAKRFEFFSVDESVSHCHSSTSSLISAGSVWRNHPGTPKKLKTCAAQHPSLRGTRATTAKRTNTHEQRSRSHKSHCHHRATISVS